jgi:hypothetical protein
VSPHPPAATWRGLSLAGALALGGLLATTHARADDLLGLSTEPIAPPVVHRAYLQYGVGIAAEAVLSAGPICSNVANCILGTGGGADIRVGYRPDPDLYIGGAYEFSKQDPNELYRLAILQQIRVEARKYFPTGRETSPFVVVGLGLQGYGNEWAVDTWGPNATLGGGLEFELGGGPVLTLVLAYRPMYFQSWVDTSTISHASGVAHFLTFEVSLEARDALWGAPTKK